MDTESAAPRRVACLDSCAECSADTRDSTPLPAGARGPSHCAADACARVLKFSKSLSGIVVLMRTVVKSGSAMVLIATFALLNCVLFASLMMATADVGEYKQDGDYAKQYTSPPSHPALASQPHPSPHRRHIPTPVRRRFQVFARGWINFCFLRDVGVLVVVSADSRLTDYSAARARSRSGQIVAIATALVGTVRAPRPVSGYTL